MLAHTEVVAHRPRKTLRLNAVGISLDFQKADLIDVLA